MKGAFCDDVPNIQASVTRVLKNIPKTKFKKSMDKLIDRSKRCIHTVYMWTGSVHGETLFDFYFIEYRKVYL